MEKLSAGTDRSDAIGKLFSVVVLLSLVAFDPGMSPVRTSLAARSSVSTCNAAPSEYFLFLPYDTSTGGDWLERMTAAFDHHYPDYTCSLGLTTTCLERGMEIAIWESELARPIQHDGRPFCYDGGCGGISGYQGVTGESIIFYDGHDGYDWAIQGGENVPILAAASGEVTEIRKPDGAYGWTVVIDHLNGYQTLYSHLKENSVTKKPGDCVGVGEPIGIQGRTGKSTGIHLHFRVLHYGQPTDPFGWCYYCTDPPPDPLRDFKGESSKNLWYGTNPRSVGQPPTRPNIGMIWGDFSTHYLGGPGVYLPIELPSSDAAVFFADITIPDDTVVTPGQALHKVWRVRNTGTSTWGSGYQLAFVGGDQMGAQAAVDVPVAAPGAQVDIPVDMTAPGAQGSYAGYWQLRNAQGTYFGPRLWVEITVQSASSYVTILSADPPSPSDTAMVRIHARSEEMPNFRAMRLKVDGQVVYELGAPEFYYDWNTAGYAAGDHSLVVEAADQSDTAWSHPERRAMSYTLLGNTQPLNHRPNPPSPTSPYDWYVYYSGNTAQLCAQHNGDPDGDAITGYYFDVYDSAQLWNSGWVGSNCVTTGALGPYNYQWRVKVHDSNGAESDWSNTWHFTLVNPDLAITEFYFEPLDPDSEQVKIRACTAGQAGIGITMRVSVNDASDSSDSGQWHIIKELGVHCFNDEDAPVWRTLDYGDGPHRVRVEAHGVNTGWEGAAVQERTYTLPHRRPASPQLLRPVVASDFGRTSWLNSRTVGFAWQDTLRANQYRLCASLDSDACVNPILDVALDGNTTQYAHTFDQDYWPLHWRIDASNDRGSTSSGTAHMGIDRTSPACSVQALPPVVYESVFQVSWSGSDNASGVRSFDVEYMDSERGTWSEWLGSVPASRSYELFTGQPGHAYAFRCRATDNANNTSLYPEDSDTSTTVDPASRPPTPWWNNDYGQKRNVVILNNMSDATLPAGYPVLLRFDSSTSPSAAEIYNASLSSPKCNDLRVVYNDTTELDRAVQACSETKIEVWFRTSVSIPPGSSDPSSHQLYYGHAGAGSPPGSIATVFYPAVDSNTRVMLYSQEGSGQVVYDSSGYGNNCTFASDLLGWTTGKFGAHAVLFPGDPPDGPALNCGNNGLDLSAFTIEMFLKRNSLQPGIDWLAGQREAGAPAKYVLWLYGHQPQLEVWPCPGCTSSTATSNRQLADLERHHVAVSFDGNNQVRFYIDGVLDSVRTLNFSGWTPSSAHLQIGSGDILRRFSGDISFFRLSNNVRTDFSYGTFVSLKNEPTAAAGEVVQPPEAGSADLALAGMTAYPNPMGGALVQAVVVNQGDRATQNGFYTDLYVDNQPTGPDDFAGSIRFWVNDPIEPGVTVTLTTVLTDVVGLAGRTQTEPLGESTVALYSQTDSEGLVGEPDDQNNISSGLAVCVASPDQYEEDNTATAAKWIEMDSAQSHNFDRLADQDWLKFGAQAGKTYVLSTSDLGAAGDTYLYLYDTDQTTLLAANDDYGGSLASRIEWTAPASGTYFVLVKHWNSNVGGCGTIYDVTLSVAVPNTLFLPLVHLG